MDDAITVTGQEQAASVLAEAATILSKASAPIRVEITKSASGFSLYAFPLKPED